MPRSSETPSSGRALLVTGLRRCDGSHVAALTEPHRSTTVKNSKPPSKPRRPSFRRRPESRNHARHRNTRPNRHPASEAPPERRTGYRPAPVPTVSNACAFPGSQSHPQARRSATPPPQAPDTPSLPAQAGIKTHARLSPPPAQTGTPRRSPINRRNWIPACAGTTSLKRGCSCRATCAATRWRTANLHRSPSPPVNSGAKAGIQNPHPCPRHTPRLADERPGLIKRCTSRPERHPRPKPTQRQTAHRPAPVRRARAGLRLHPRQPCTTANPRLD